MKKINEYMNIKEAAEYIGVARNTLRNWEAKKKLVPSRHPINKYRLYSKESLNKILLDMKEERMSIIKRIEEKTGQTDKPVTEEDMITVNQDAIICELGEILKAKK